MEKLDRLGWTDGFSFVAYGRHYGIRTNQPQLIRALRGLAPPGSRWSDAEVVSRLYSLRGGRERRGLRRFNLAYAGVRRIARELDLDLALRILESNLHLEVAASARRCLFVHAGVVAWDGRAIVLPGPSLAGKSTLVDALLHEGAIYYSDEYAVIDPNGLIHPFARPLRLRAGPGSSRRIDPGDLGVSVGTRAVAAGVVCFTEFEHGAPGRFRPIRAGRSVLSLLRNTVAARIAPERAFEYLPRMIAGAKLIGGKRGEAQPTARLLLDHLDRLKAIRSPGT